MEPITLSVIATLLAPFLLKAGEKVTEKTVEELFDSRKDIAEKFKELFQSEIVSLGLNNSSSSVEIVRQVETPPEIKEQVRKKLANNGDLLRDLIEAFTQMPQSEFDGITINAKNIGQVINNPTAPITQTNKFS